MAPPSCESASITLENDTQGRTWEHYWLGQQYQLSNQIPNRASYTRTQPGWILADSGLCAWQWEPPARIAEVASIAPQPIAAVPLQATAGGGDGAMGLLLLLGMAGAGVWAWIGRDKDIDPDYHPMADAPSFPMAYTDETEPGFLSGVTEPSPWLEDQTGWTVADRIPNMVEVLPRSRRPTQAEPLRSMGFTVPEPPLNPALNASEPVLNLEPEPGFNALNPAFKAFLEGAPYDMSQDDEPLLEAMQLAVEAGVPKAQTCSFFYSWKNQQGRYIKAIVTKGGTRDYQRFSELYDSVKGT
jgi:hypothetical protein